MRRRRHGGNNIDAVKTAATDIALVSQPGLHLLPGSGGVRGALAHVIDVTRGNLRKQAARTQSVVGSIVQQQQGKVSASSGLALAMPSPHSCMCR